MSCIRNLMRERKVGNLDKMLSNSGGFIDTMLRIYYNGKSDIRCYHF